MNAPVSTSMPKDLPKLPALVNAGALLESAPPPRVDFVLPGLPAGQVGLLVGGDGAGKSGLALQIALSVACGIPTCGGVLAAPAGTGRVVMIMGEDDIDEFHRSLRNRLLPVLLGSVATNKEEAADLQTRLRNGLMNLEVLPLAGERLPLMEFPVFNGE